MNKIYRYFVEGKCEKALLKAFMYSNGNAFQEGKVDVFNFINEKMTNQSARSIKKGTRIVIIVDTDVNNTINLSYNISLLKRVALVKEEDIIFIPSVRNFEEELLYACNGIKNINQIFSTDGLSEFKNKFITHSDIKSKLLSLGFDINKMWSREAPKPFDSFKNKSNSIRKNNK